MWRAAYQAVRRLHVIDVLNLMHLQADSLDSSVPDSGYQLRSIQQAELRQRIDAGTAPPAIGDPGSLVLGERVCVVAIHDERIASFLWIARDRVSATDNFSRSPHLGTSLDLPHASAFVFNAWTDPDHRGRGLIAELLGYVIRHRLLGTQTLWATTDWTNDASIRALEKIGMKSMGLIWRFGKGPFQVSKLPHVPATLGLRIADDARGIVFNQS